MTDYTWPLANGEVSDPVMQCDRCAQGARELIEDEPDKWEWAKDGSLRAKSVEPYVLTRTAAVDRMHAALTSAIVAGQPESAATGNRSTNPPTATPPPSSCGGGDVGAGAVPPGGAQLRLEVFHPLSGVAVVLPNGYRWHVFTRHADRFGVGAAAAVLFSPEREFVRWNGTTVAVVLGDASTSEDEVASMVRDLVRASGTDRTFLANAIGEHILTEMQVQLFNADDLLEREP